MNGRSRSKPSRPARRRGSEDDKAPATSGSAPGTSPKGVRLQRFLADSGVASRRESEAMIEAGRVEVNGQAVTTLPVFIRPGRDRVTVDGRAIDARAARSDRVYVMLNKPERTLTTTRDTGAVEKDPRRTVLDLVDHPSGARLYPVGRLDYHATGLLLLTNDGELTQRLTHARYGIGQTYRVWVAGRVNEDTLDMLRRRVGKRTETPAEDASGGPAYGGVRVDVRPGDRRPTGDVSQSTVLEITLREGRRESVADMLLAAGCRVKKMVRVAMGPVRMRAVGVGEWRDLFADEVQALREATGLPGNGAAGRHRPRRNRETRR